jgi:hypothetical protein
VRVFKNEITGVSGEIAGTNYLAIIFHARGYNVISEL